MKKSNHSIFIFLPAAGNYADTTLHDKGSRGNYWSSSWYNNSYSYYLNFNSANVSPQNYNSRYYGCSVRAVQSSS